MIARLIFLITLTSGVVACAPERKPDSKPAAPTERKKERSAEPAVDAERNSKTKPDASAPSGDPSARGDSSAPSSSEPAISGSSQPLRSAPSGDQGSNSNQDTPTQKPSSNAPSGAAPTTSATPKTSDSRQASATKPEQVSPSLAQDKNSLWDKKDLDGLPAPVPMHEQLWNTELGKMFADFALGNASWQESRSKARRIIRRIYEKGSMIDARRAAIGDMTINLLERGFVEPLVSDRIVMMNLLIELHGQRREARVGKMVANGMIYLAVISAAYGSNDLRASVYLLPKKLVRKIRPGRPLMSGEERAAATSAAAKSSWEKFVDASLKKKWQMVRRRYSFGHATGLFSFGGAVGTITYVMFAGGADAVNAEEKIWVYGLQNFQHIGDL